MDLNQYYFNSFGILVYNKEYNLFRKENIIIYSSLIILINLKIKA